MSAGDATVSKPHIASTSDLHVEFPSLSSSDEANSKLASKYSATAVNWRLAHGSRDQSRQCITNSLFPFGPLIQSRPFALQTTRVYGGRRMGTNAFCDRCSKDAINAIYSLSM